MAEITLSNGMVVLIDDADLAIARRHRWHAHPAGRTVYARWIDHRTRPRRIVYLHRILTGAPANQEVDHANGDGLDNRRSNLRVVSKTENCRNRIRKPSGKSSRFKGVSWQRDANKYSAKISVGGRSKHIGLFANEVAAALAYDAFALEHFGEFAALNFPRPSSDLIHTPSPSEVSLGAPT